MTQDLISLAEQYPGLTVQIKLDDLLKAGRTLTGEILDYIAAHGTQAAASSAQQDELLTSEEACRKLSVSNTTLWRMAQSGHLTPVKVGVQNRYRLSDIAELISKKGGRV